MSAQTTTELSVLASASTSSPPPAASATCDESESDGRSEVQVGQLSEQLKQVSIASSDKIDAESPPSDTQKNDNAFTIICDAGYGFPREARPRKEKIMAVARQVANFINWQMESANERECARIVVVGCNTDADKQALQQRTQALITARAPHVSFSCEALEDCVADGTVYLSPDATDAVDPTAMPPRTVVVGLLIDRRVQLNRSKDRAHKLDLIPKRWPLEQCFQNISTNEPLNVDCVLEGQQQWQWNWQDATMRGRGNLCFLKAAEQAIQHHAKRHPGRTLHT